MKQWIEPRKLLNGLLVEFRGNMRKCPKLLMQLHPPLHAAGHILKSGWDVWLWASPRARDSRSPHAHDTIDAIVLENIDGANESLVGCTEDKEDELVYEGGDLAWGTVVTTVGATRTSMSTYYIYKFKSYSTLIDEESKEEEDEEQYNEMDLGLPRIGKS
ncbi:hypothetical protein KY290_010242 [Solanum tuberosum]|uniref:Uncharacterized protein n=1 Tax=Solanum tuberosum TaxID=4113 RepID=A0ABQ7VXW6_SOLTU|nr:hypothetical protein KY290_010242 [Solanum tuberosum]